MWQDAQRIHGQRLRQQSKRTRKSRSGNGVTSGSGSYWSTPPRTATGPYHLASSIPIQRSASHGPPWSTPTLPAMTLMARARQTSSLLNTPGPTHPSAKASTVQSRYRRRPPPSLPLLHPTRPVSLHGPVPRLLVLAGVVLGLQLCSTIPMGSPCPATCDLSARRHRREPPPTHTPPSGGLHSI